MKIKSVGKMSRFRRRGFYDKATGWLNLSAKQKKEVVASDFKGTFDVNLLTDKEKENQVNKIVKERDKSAKWAAKQK